MHMPLYTINKIKQGFTVDNPNTDHNNYLSILDLAYGSYGSDAYRIPSLYSHMSTNFGKMVNVCLTLQREGDLTQDMLDTLIDTIEILNP